MTQRNIWMMCGTAALVAAVFAGYASKEQKNAEGAQKMEQVAGSPQDSRNVQSQNADIWHPRAAAPINAWKFVDPVGFYRGERAVKNVRTSDGTVIAGVVNHHALAADLLAQLFRELKLARPDVRRFIILSPDHYHAGRGEISTHERTYQIDHQEMRVDVQATAQLVQEMGIVRENGAMYEQEHGIGALIPFLAAEFPEAQIVPISLQSSMNREDARKLGVELTRMWDEHTLVIVSSDMSHYLPRNSAWQNDVVTMGWLRSCNISALAQAKDDFVDTGVSLVALCTFLQSVAPNAAFTNIGHAISSDYGGAENNTTSYITGVWTR